MQIMAYIALGAAVLCGVLRCVSGTYIFSACMSLLCACAAAAADAPADRWILAAGLAVSVIADWFLAHQSGRPERFLYGVAGFFVAHCLFSWYGFMRYAFNMPALCISLGLLLVYAVYMGARLLSGMDKMLRMPLVAYMLASLLSIYAALSMNAPMAERLLYIAGIAAILFSDTMIGENVFAGVKAAERLVLPTYYLCHTLITLSVLMR